MIRDKACPKALGLATTTLSVCEERRLYCSRIVVGTRLTSLSQFDTPRLLTEAIQSAAVIWASTSSTSHIWGHPQLSRSWHSPCKQRDCQLRVDARSIWSVWDLRLWRLKTFKAAIRSDRRRQKIHLPTNWWKYSRLRSTNGMSLPSLTLSGILNSCPWLSLRVAKWAHSTKT